MAALPLPDDAVAAILRRLPPRTLAAARCVSKRWCAIIDGRALLLPHLLPQSVHGILINSIDHGPPDLFSRPQSSSSPPFSSAGAIHLTSSLPESHWKWCSVLDHCDGLLLCGAVEWVDRLSVCNPATRRWATLPPQPESAVNPTPYLAFDPAVSPHYEVLLIPGLPPPPPRVFCLRKLFESMDGADKSFGMESMDDDDDNDDDDDDDELYGSMEWPPSPYRVEVFSSRSGRWEEREFVREGETVTTVEDMKPDWYYVARRGYGVVWQGALYVNCKDCFVIRFSLSNHKYQVIRIPINILDGRFGTPHLGKSNMGVCFGLIRGRQLSVWILNESAGQMEWVLKYQHDLTLFAKQVGSIDFQLINRPWAVQEDDSDMDENTETLSDEDLEWDSDNDGFLPIEVDDDVYNTSCIGILGFHPYKEVIFLDQSFQTFAYHLNSSKIQYLGHSHPKYYYHDHSDDIFESFVYTPCMIGELHGDYIGQSSS